MKRRKVALPRFLKLNYAGLALGTILYCFSLTPSLLPRDATFEGFVAGLSFAAGYAIGVSLSWIFRQVVHFEPPKHTKRYAWWGLFAVMLLAIIAYGVWSATWQNQVRELIGENDFEGRHIITIQIVAIIITALLLWLGRLIRKLVQLFSRFSARWVPQRISTAIGMAATLVVLVLLYNGVLTKAFVGISNHIYSAKNDTTASGITQPTSALRSGGPQSDVAWNTLGRQGRNFIGSGPSQEELTKFSGQPATEPIRVYVGLESADTAADRAALAVKELKRTGAFNRPVLAVMTVTGTGWVQPQMADSLEYMWNGDSAIVSQQYSYLPSWISFLVDQQKAADAGQALFNAVYAEWKQMPVEHRPKLLAFGLSLGSYGAQSAFSGVDDLQNRTDGALFLGTPSTTPLWQHFETNRDTGSPEWQPVIQKGAAVRFAADKADILAADQSWKTPRTLYMQHPSDPVVWWNWDLIWNKPDWLREKRGPDVSPNMQWYPIVTFFQVTVDQFFGVTAPVGHGHNYQDDIVAAWGALATPPNWNDTQATALQKIIDTYHDK